MSKMTKNKFAKLKTCNKFLMCLRVSDLEYGLQYVYTVYYLYMYDNV